MVAVPNPYSGQDLVIAKSVSDNMGSLVARGESPRPFRRQVDAWWIAMAIGTRQGHKTPLSGQTVKFNTGEILGNDPWRITHLELLALADTNDEGVLERPGEVVRIASEYANTGFEWIVANLVGPAQPTLTFINRIGEFL